MNFSEIVNSFIEVSKISSTNERIEWLKNHDDPDFKEVLKWYLDPSVVTGIAEKKYDKVNGENYKFEILSHSFKQVMNYLERNNTGSDIDVAYVKASSKTFCKTDLDFAVFRSLICKNFPMGLQEGIVNKAFPNLVPTFDVMLANNITKLNDNQLNKVTKNGTREFNVTTKMDGFRCIVYKKGDVVKLVSRQGKLYERCVDIEAAVKSLPGDFVLDSEIIISNRKTLPSTLQYKATSNIVTLKDQDKHGVTCNCFDFIPMEEWESKKSVTPYYERRSMLESLLKDFADKDDKPLYLVPLLYVGQNIDEAWRLHSIAKQDQEEGVMVRFSDSVYEFKRSNDLLKMKVFADMDVTITGYEEGTNQNTGRLGAFLYEVDHPEFGNLKFKVGGGYSDKERDEYWAQKDQLIGRIMEITYFEVTQNKTTGQKSVRFPVHKCIKPIGQEANN